MIRQEYYDEFADKQAFESMIDELKLLRSRLSKMEKELKIYRVDYILLNEYFTKRKLLSEINDREIIQLRQEVDKLKGGKNRRIKQQG